MNQATLLKMYLIIYETPGDVINFRAEVLITEVSIILITQKQDIMLKLFVENPFLPPPPPHSLYCSGP